MVNLLGVWLYHYVTVDQNGAHDCHSEEWMGEDVDGDPPDGMERREEEHGLLGREPEYRPALRDDDERLLVQVVGVDVTDGGAGELQRKLAVPSRQVVSCSGKRKGRKVRPLYVLPLFRNGTTGQLFIDFTPFFVKKVNF